MTDPLRAALESVIRLIEPIPLSVDVEQAGMQAEVATATARAALAADTAPLDAITQELDRRRIDEAHASGYREGSRLAGREADRQAAYKAGWDDARAVIAEPLDVEVLMRTMRYRPNLQGKAVEYVDGWDAATVVLLDLVSAVRLAKERDQG